MIAKAKASKIIKIAKKSPIMMPCISRKLCVGAKAFHCLSHYLVLIVLLNNLHCSTSALSTTVPSTFGGNSSSHEPVCANVKDIMSQRGIADKDLPVKFPIKGELSSLPTKGSSVKRNEVKLLPKDVFHVLLGDERRSPHSSQPYHQILIHKNFLL